MGNTTAAKRGNAGPQLSVVSGTSAPRPVSARRGGPGRSANPLRGRGGGQEFPKPLEGTFEERQRRRDRRELFNLVSGFARTSREEGRMPVVMRTAVPHISSLAGRFLGELVETARSSADSSVRSAAAYFISLAPTGNEPTASARRNDALRRVASTSCYSDTRAFAETTLKNLSETTLGRQ